MYRQPVRLSTPNIFRCDCRCGSDKDATRLRLTTSPRRFVAFGRLAQRTASKPIRLPQEGPAARRAFRKRRRRKYAVSTWDCETRSSSGLLASRADQRKEGASMKLLINLVVGPLQ
jgi:hypothetical protein